MEARKFRVFVFFRDFVIQALTRRAREHGNTEHMEARKFRVFVFFRDFVIQALEHV